MNFCRNKKILFFSIVRFSRIFKHLFSEMFKSVFYRFNGIQDNLSESVFYRFNGIENNLSESVFYTESVFLPRCNTIPVFLPMLYNIEY